MTAPVAAERGADGQWVIRFFMPSEYTLESFRPRPTTIGCAWSQFRRIGWRY